MKITKCPKCGNRLDVYFNDDKQSSFHYECRFDDGGCGWISDKINAKPTGNK